MKLFMILYVDESVIMSESASYLQTLPGIVFVFFLYWGTWKMKANVDKTKSKDYYQEIFILVITGLLLRYNVFKFFNYLGIDISWTRSVRVCKKFLSENAIKAMYEIMKREENIIFLLAVNFFDKLIKKNKL